MNARGPKDKNFLTGTLVCPAGLLLDLVPQAVLPPVRRRRVRARPHGEEDAPAAGGAAPAAGRGPRRPAPVDWWRRGCSRHGGSCRRGCGSSRTCRCVRRGSCKIAKYTVWRNLALKGHSKTVFI